LEHRPFVTVADGGLFGGFTVCGSPADVLPLKFESPAYVAVSDLLPAEVKVTLQLPSPAALMLPVQPFWCRR